MSFCNQKGGGFGVLTMQKGQVGQFLSAVSQKMKVLVPSEENGTVLFLPWNGERKIEWNKKSTLPPKDILFPKVEALYSYQLQGADVKIKRALLDAETTLLFGVRSCDARSFMLMDKVFLGDQFVEAGYAARRDKTLIVALACSEELSPACYCTSMGVDPQGGQGADLILHQLGPAEGGEKDILGVESLTPGGNNFLNEYRDEFFDVYPDEGVPKKDVCKFVFETQGVAGKLRQIFEHPLWEELSRRCLSCGICTYLCPTCHCFDIPEGKTYGKGESFRCWDSCMFPDFTLMAGGYNPRPTRTERFRNRFMHKLCFFPERYGELACTGCGRCLEHCPVHLDSSLVVSKVLEVETGAK